jgi:hypothetical protein
MQRRSLFLDLGGLAILALVVVAFFWPLVLGGYWIPRGGGDLVSFIWPMYRFAAHSLRLGQIPLWNPYVYGGAPFVADNQSGVFYPINLLVFALFGEPPYEVVEGLVVFHVWLAGVTMFALLRGLGLQQPAVVFGGVAFALSDLFVTHIGNLNLNATAAWLPLMLLLAHLALIQRSVGWAAGAGVVLALAALAGHGQMLLYAGLMLAGYVAYRLVLEAANRKWEVAAFKRLLQVCLLGATIVIVGVGAAALTLFPAWEMAGHTGRGHLAYEEATAYSLPPRALVGLLVPGFYGRGEVAFWGSWSRVEVGYAGVATLALAVLGVCVWASAQVCRRRVGKSVERKEREWVGEGFPGGFFVLLAVLGFVLAIGQYTPVYWVLYRFVPTFDQVRVPARLIVLADLGLAALAAYGLDRLRLSCFSRWVGLGAVMAAPGLLAIGLWQARTVPPARVAQATNSIVVASVLLVSSGVLVRLTRRFRWGAWLLVVLLAADLIALGSMLEAEPNDPTLGFSHADVVAFLRRDANLFRIESSPARAWQPDAALVHGLYDIGGVFNPLGVAPYHAYRWAVGERGAPLYDLLGVKYVLADKGKPPGDERLVPVYTENSEMDVYLNTEALPIALLVYDTRVVADHAAAWAALFDDFDPAQVVILEERQAGDLPALGDRGLESEGGRIEFVRYDLNEIELAVEIERGGWLVLSEVYYPGWRATVDGEQTEVLRADYTFRAVRLEPGEHTVRTWFAPWTWTVGLMVSVATWAGLAVWVGFRVRGCLVRPDGAVSEVRG